MIQYSDACNNITTTIVTKAALTQLCALSAMFTISSSESSTPLDGMPWFQYSCMHTMEHWVDIVIWAQILKNVFHVSMFWSRDMKETKGKMLLSVQKFSFLFPGPKSKRSQKTSIRFSNRTNTWWRFPATALPSNILIWVSRTGLVFHADKSLLFGAWGPQHQCKGQPLGISWNSASLL